MMTDYIAHRGQKLYEHLEGVAKLAKKNTHKIGMGDYGELMGLLHDFGKYSAEFKKYITDALKKDDPEFNPDEDEEFEDPSGKKGKIDHSTAGAQYLSKISGYSDAHKILCQILSLCLVSHHSGLIDCLTTDNRGILDSYSKRLSKNDKKTHQYECVENVDKFISDRINAILEDNSLTKPFEELCRSIILKDPEQNPQSMIVQFQLSMLVRFLYSGLIDADRQDTADSEKPKIAQHRQLGNYKKWDTLIERLENKYKTFVPNNRVDEIRKAVSEDCLLAAKRPKG